MSELEDSIINIDLTYPGIKYNLVLSEGELLTLYDIIKCSTETYNSLAWDLLDRKLKRFLVSEEKIYDFLF